MRQRGQRIKKGGAESKDRWMITYADLITLLLIFFVIMYAMSRLDTEKYKNVTESLQLTFNSGSGGGNSVLDGSNVLTGSEKPNIADHPAPGSDPKSSAAPAESQGPKSGEQPLSERELAFRKQEEQLANLMSMIEQYVKDNHLENQIFVTDKPQGIAITLSDQFLFDTGKADLKAGSEKMLAKLGSLFSQLNLGTKISIEGHTDNQPIVHTSKYQDNWELSGARALSVLRYFLDVMQLDPDSFQYAGYGDTHPAADNATKEGRQKNRRVEITVLRQLQR
ncbi:OmpA/MotB family protein [Paenibacillus caui]|uniref:OmpA/MotB family protein n=1 Tax=Paenibacillus caui TaxID=2873927 RepID=UPI001CAA333E|nr:flagellar motor protein MotB [Paenibacillus caui]